MSIRVSYYTITKGIYKYTKLIPIKAVKTVELYESSDAIDEDYEWLIRAFCSAQHKQKATYFSPARDEVFIGAVMRVGAEWVFSPWVVRS